MKYIFDKPEYLLMIDTTNIAKCVEKRYSEKTRHLISYQGFSKTPLVLEEALPCITILAEGAADSVSANVNAFAAQAVGPLIFILSGKPKPKKIPGSL